jgi:AsmA-like C-terminal region/AsmA family
MPRWLKNTFKSIAGIAIFLLLLLSGAMLYVTYNKAKVLKLVNTELGKNLDGTVTVGDMQPRFFKGFPNISLALKNVLVRDRRFSQHHHTLLDAKDFDISVNAGALLSGGISINHIVISNAAIDLYTDSTGYSNSSVFINGKKNKKNKSSTSKTSAELEKFTLTNVGFRVEDQKAKKLFNFIVNNINGKITYPDSGFRAAFHMDVTAKSMAFNIGRGSFIKNKTLEGDLEATYNQETGTIKVTADALDIGDDPFKIDAVFETGNGLSGFSIYVVSGKILWRDASALVADNIRQKLNQFNIDKPIAVTALIKGSLKGAGDPFLHITAVVKDSKVTTPGGTIDNCSFNGIFTNNYQNGKGLNDDNSVIRLIKMTGSYSHLPFAIDTGSIINLNKPIATGNFRSAFPVVDLNYLLGNRIARFSRGTADMRLRYKADIVNYQLTKPFVSGAINIKNADINYIPENLLLKNSSVSLYFIGDDLLLKNIRLQTGRSIVTMEGRVHNFLNLYYKAPEKILLTWQIHSPQLYLAEFFGFLGGSKPTTTRSTNSGNIIDQLGNVLEKGNAAIHLDAANVHYNKFLATDAHADLLTIQHGLIIKNAGVKHAGGFLRLSGSIKKEGTLNRLSLNTTVSSVDVREFFYAFDNFGLKDFTYENLKGFLSARTDITAGITGKGTLVPGSINGSLDINLKHGALVNFKPIGSVAKFAFPFRNLKNITFDELNARFDVHGTQFTIYPMKISSSALNMDVAGVYGLSKGTNIELDVPLRNPKNDTTIHDEQKLLKKRYKGIVLHILAKSDSTGKIKIGWNKDRKKE